MLRLLIALLLASDDVRSRHVASVTSTAVGRAPRIVTCEKCAYKYVYLIEATETYKASMASDHTREVAEAADTGAINIVQQTLRHAVELVPCSQCGHVQDHMVPLARKRHLTWMQTAGLGFLVLAFCSFVPALYLTAADDSPGKQISPPAIIAWSLALTLATLGMGLFFARMKAVARYDPNSQPLEKRKKSGDDQSVSLAEYEQMERSSQQKRSV